MEADAAAFDANGSGRGPAGATLVAAGEVAFAVFAANEEGGGFHVGDDDDAVGIGEHVLGDAFIGRGHDFGEDGGGLVEAFGRFVVFGQERSDGECS